MSTRVLSVHSHQLVSMEFDHLLCNICSFVMSVAKVTLRGDAASLGVNKGWQL